MNNKNLDEHNDQKYGSPTSTLSDGYGQVYGSFPQGDENLPEVRIDTSPQALSNLEAEYKRRHLEEREPKYPVIYDNAPETVVPAERSLPPESVTAGEREQEQVPSAEEPPAKKGKICGLTRRMFFIVLVALLVIIAAAVGGGVGGTVSSSRSKNAAPVPVTTTSSEPSSKTITPAVASQSSTSTTGTTSTSSTTTSASPTATFLNNQTAPANSFAFQGFSGHDYLGNATSIVRDEGGTDFAFNINSYVWLPNTTSCCLSFCLNATNEGEAGWWCDARYQKNSSGPFPRIFVWCGQEQTDANAKCV
ncbi:uncharacterized protein PAC_16996 [Phialocephala subalpina]|uniref:Uncharacterized protein n=1 Tax=Phialocephala subalpina TaxID=576137 RepID=A0A1L7XQ88_9HELO|nr:uncharacterized protein PAC_16996 [Phialocephala subalpina]